MNLFTKRLIALLIDLLIVGIPAGIITFVFSIIHFVLSILPIFKVFAFLFVAGPLVFFLFIVYETLAIYFFQKTIGKAIMQIQVVNKNYDSDLSFFTCGARAFCKAVTIYFGWGVFAVISCIVAFQNPSSSVADLIVNTEVCSN